MYFLLFMLLNCFSAKIFICECVLISTQLESVKESAIFPTEENILGKLLIRR